MEEKVLAKGVFSQFNVFMVMFLYLAVLGLVVTYVDTSGTKYNEPSPTPVIAAIMIFVGVIGAIISYLWLSKCEITVTNKRVYGMAAFSKRVDLPLDKISSVDTCYLKGVGVATSSGRIKFFLCKNRDEVFDAISKLLLERQNSNKTIETVVKQEVAQSNADELKKYKELLDMGAITQEEYDAKKKQLLDL